MISRKFGRDLISEFTKVVFCRLSGNELLRYARISVKRTIELTFKKVFRKWV